MSSGEFLHFSDAYKDNMLKVETMQIPREHAVPGVCRSEFWLWKCEELDGGL